MKIAFIGLGNMGGGMAANLVKAGHSVHAFDLSAEATVRATGNGCAVFPTVREAVEDANDALTAWVGVDPAAIRRRRDPSMVLG